MISKNRATWLGVAAAIAVAVLAPAEAGAQDAIKVVSHRYPALEYYAKAMEGALPGTKVEVSLMPQDKSVELSVLTLSKESDAYDVVWANDSVVQRFAKSGWLEPLDALWAKYKAQFALGDIPDSILASYRYQGKLYAIPFNTNVQFFFYRADVFKEKGLKPPKTFDEYLKLAKALSGPGAAGTIMSLKPVDAALNETHWYMNAFGAKWFDDKWKPAFNSSQGVKAIETMKALSAYAPRGFTSHANDESTVNLQQGLAMMGLQWASRAAAMDDPAKSRVVGKIEWAPPPGGGARLVTDAYAISRFSKKDKDLVFRMLATASNEESMRKAGGLLLPPRQKVLLDTELQKKYRHWPAALEAMKVDKTYPSLPEFTEVGETITRRVLQAVTGEAPVKTALDQAAAEVTEMLAKRGYYKN